MAREVSITCTIPVTGVLLATMISVPQPVAGMQDPTVRYSVRGDSVEWTDSVTTRAKIWMPAGPQPDFPTLIFSPGFGQAPASYSVMLADWARHGYLVIGITHPTFNNPDGVELYDAAQAIARQLVNAVSHIVRERRRAGSPFSRVDLQRIGVVGHSVGGAAAAQACAWDPSIKAGMDLDGTIFGEVVHMGVRQPFFLLRRTVVSTDRDPPRFLERNDQASLHEDSLFTHTPTMYWLTVDGLDHMAFTDAALRPTATPHVPAIAGGGPSAMRTQEITTRYVLDFFGHYLSGTPWPSSLDQSPFTGTVLRHKR